MGMWTPPIDAGPGIVSDCEEPRPTRTARLILLLRRVYFFAASDRKVIDDAPDVASEMRPSNPAIMVGGTPRLMTAKISPSLEP